jgi:hypothetical protein
VFLALIALLVLLWLLGVALNVVGALIHIVLVVAAILLVFQLARRAQTPA